VPINGFQESPYDQLSCSSNGGTEEVNKVIKPCLAKLIDTNHEDWDVYLPMAVSSYNNAFHVHSFRGSFW
jgi:hypothetical protein